MFKNMLNTSTTVGTGDNVADMILQFPEDLGTNSLSSDGKSLEHFVILYINTMQNDRYFNKDKGSMKGKINSNDKPAYESVSRPESITTVVSDKDQSTQSITEKVLNIHSWVRTTMMIALPMPTQISKTYAANWGGISTAGNMATDMLAAYEAGGLGGGTKSIIEKYRQQFLNKSPALAAKSGVALNPRTEVLFESINPGNNTLDWTLYPRTPEESKAIWNIIQILKWCMLPDVEKDGIFYNVPNTVDLEYWYGNKRNDWLPRSMTAYIRDVNVNYCPTTHWVALDLDRDSADWPSGKPPVGVSISISLGELIPLDKRIIDPDGDLTFGRSKQGIF